MSKELDECFDDFGRVKGRELKKYLKSKLEFSEEKAEKVSEGIVAAQEANFVEVVIENTKPDLEEAHEKIDEMSDEFFGDVEIDEDALEIEVGELDEDSN